MQDDEWMEIWVAITGVALAWLVVGTLVMLIVMLEGP